MLRHCTSGLASRFTRLLALALTALVMGACASGMRTDKADDNLVEVERGNFDHVLMQPEQSLPRFSRVFILEPEVYMSDYWLRDHRNDYTDRDLDRIKRDYSRFLRETLAETLAEKSALDVVETAAEADMILRPSLTELNIYAPDIGTGRRDHYIESAGNATLNLDFIDPRTKRVLAQFVDHRETPPIVLGQLEETNRATNNRLFRRLMERWSNNLVKYLDDFGIVPRR